MNPFSVIFSVLKLHEVWYKLKGEFIFVKGVFSFVFIANLMTLFNQVNGVNTQGENIADNGAVKLAYAAYQTFVEQNGPEPILPELNYTPNQLFWLSSAQLWCAVTRPEFDTMQYTTDVHAPNEYRIIGTLSNVDSFSHDFNCPSGSNMNPINKCVVW